jgi:hypothetical protein
MTTWTTADLAALDRAIATGALKIRFADGREVTYRSLAEMRSLRSEIAAATGSAEAVSRTTYAAYCRD